MFYEKLTKQNSQINFTSFKLKRTIKNQLYLSYIELDILLQFLFSGKFNQITDEPSGK